ncbi:hypothetical protein BDF20DRAFT_839412 [Mycotypha africana]|uniref:uncharacterized protein n=1 Tax=Mycotypha africana TaxID=64632 RepID=UPI00230066AD|nr:uncharacterized protein BDF20DRAFT_839412 [Mycotypha africana]KAI8968290.1 hypothetical protein BDF20DRAFT_839412 [Mycotypha africana]
MSSQTISLENADQFILDFLNAEGGGFESSIVNSSHTCNSRRNSDTHKKCKTANSGGNSAATDAVVESDDEFEESFTCTICHEAWYSTGCHRAVSIKCGHLFGKQEMDSGEEKKICAPAELGDLRLIIPARIAVKDTSNSRDLYKEIDSLKMQIKCLEKAVDISRMSLNLYKREYQKAKEKRIMIGTTSAEKLIKTSYDINIEPDPTPVSMNMEACSATTQDTVVIPTAPNTVLNINDHSIIPHQNRIIERFTIYTSYRVSTQRNICSAMAIRASANSAYVSLKVSPENYSIVNINVGRQSTVDINYPSNAAALNTTTSMSGLMPNIHASQINALQCFNHTLLSTGVDKTLKITCVDTNQVEQIMELPQPGRTCQFDPLDTTKVYCGLSNSQVMIFDLRNPNHAVNTLKNESNKNSPLHSMLIRNLGDNKKDIYCSNLNETFIWRWENGYRPYSLSFHATLQNQYEEDEGTLLLLSSRHQGKAMKHQIICVNSTELDRIHHPDILLDYNIPLQQNSMRKTCSFSDSKEDIATDSIICYSDEEYERLCFGRAKNEFHSLRIHSCPNDIQFQKTYGYQARHADGLVAFSYNNFKSLLSLP